MIKKKTIVIVGAGASKEVGLPIGSELTGKIARLLNIQAEFGRRNPGDSLILDALRWLTRQDDTKFKIEDYLRAAHRIKTSMPLAESIDNFIDDHNGNKLIEYCGKLAIVRSILEAEMTSKLYFDFKRGKSSFDHLTIENTWFNKFFKVLTESCNKYGLAERFNSLSIVIFNYDRCIEHFLFHSIQTYYGIDADEAAKIVSGIKIYRPYGKVGSLPWQTKEEIDSIAFGAEPSVQQLLDLSKQIRTFTEGTNSAKSDIDDIRRQVKDSKIVLFLGFAFHKLNMQLLTPQYYANKRDCESKCFATAFGMSKTDSDIIKDEIAKLKYIDQHARDNVHIRNDLCCFELFDEYQRSLSI